VDEGARRLAGLRKTCGPDWVSSAAADIIRVEAFLEAHDEHQAVDGFGGVKKLTKGQQAA
jgi:hypothetical protein